MRKVLSIHLQYIVKLLHTNKIKYRVDIGNNKVCVYVGLKCAKNELLDIVEDDTEDDYPYLWISVRCGIDAQYHKDDLSNPAAYSWFIEYINLLSKAFMIHQQWERDR
jgi:hypothetical protein